MRILLILLALLSSSTLHAQTQFKLNIQEAEQAAESYESVIFSQIPKARPYISYFDIDTEDGHLLVWIKKSMLAVDKNKQTEIYRGFLDIWKQTKWVKQNIYANNLEVLYLNTETGETRTIRVVK